MTDQTQPPLSPQTLAVAAGRPEQIPGAPLSEPVWLTSTYVADGPYDYGRGGNPTWDAFETALGALEGGRARVFASGSAAVAAVVALVPDGSVVVAPGGAYYGTLAQLRHAEERGRLRLREVDVADSAQVENALDDASMLWIESPTNPLLEVADLPVLTALGRRRGLLTVVDNTFATPLVQRPLDLGADLVVHSVTKYLSGHSDLLLGAAVTRDDDDGRALDARIDGYRRLHGAVAGPHETWLALRGMRTLAVRVERSQASAATLAARLVEHPSIQRVRHPSLPQDPGHLRARAQMRGFGSIVSVQVRGGAADAERVVAATRLWVHATSLGGVESTLERRRRHRGEPAAVPENLLRLSVGIEDVDDLWHDLAQALDAAG